MIGLPLIYIGGLGFFLVDGNFMWRANMTTALEEYAQNLTQPPLGPNLTLQQRGGAYSSGRLDDHSQVHCVRVYAVSPICDVWAWCAGHTPVCNRGVVAIRTNGVDESMYFSRFLRAVLNKRMCCVEESFVVDRIRG